MRKLPLTTVKAPHPEDKPSRWTREQQIALDEIATGSTFLRAAALAGRSSSAFDLWRRNDPEYARAVEDAVVAGRMALAQTAIDVLRGGLRIAAEKAAEGEAPRPTDNEHALKVLERMDKAGWRPTSELEVKGDAVKVYLFDPAAGAPPVPERGAEKDGDA